VTEDPPSLLLPVLASEGVLAGLALGLGAWTGIDWQPMLRGSAAEAGLGILAGLGLVALHLVLLLPGGERNPLYRTIYRPLREVLEPTLRSTSIPEILLLAGASGIGEELFFRGWLQSETGIVVASLLFGAAHVWGRKALPYGLYAAGMGLVLGGLFAHTGPGLWAPILAHVVNNLVGLLALAYGWLPEAGT
jgi:membrane protease YdiL (CAAX protease family)